MKSDSLHNTTVLEIRRSAINTASYRSKTRSLRVQKIRRVLTKKRFLLVTWVLIWNILLTKHLFTPRISLFWHFKRTFTSTCYWGHFLSGGCISQSERSSYYLDLSQVGWSHERTILSINLILAYFFKRWRTSSRFMQTKSDTELNSHSNIPTYRDYFWTT